MPAIEISDAEGRYSFRLDKPGQYLFTVQRSYGGTYQEQSQNTFRVTVPKTVEHRHDIDLPGATIAGRVTTGSGAGAAGIPIMLSAPIAKAVIVHGIFFPIPFNWLTSVLPEAA